MYWLVFNRQSRPQAEQVSRDIYGRETGRTQIGPDYVQIVPVAIFRCDTAEQACQAAAKKSAMMGTYFAIEGTPWGVDMIEVEGVEELGVAPPGEDEKDRRIRALERSVLDHDVPE